MICADMVLMNGNVLTMNPSKPLAQAIAVKDDKIVEVGTDAEIQQWIGKNTKTLDLKGRTVVPGLIDTHVHIAGFGRSMAGINLRNVRSIREMQEKLEKRVRVASKESWVLGHGWDQDRLKEKRYPTRWDLDKFSPNNPVFFLRVCGHVCVVNSKALELAGVTEETISPSGGQIDKNAETSEPTGILRENAMDLALKARLEPSEEELSKACGLACQKAVESGLTSVHWLISSPAEIRVIQKLRAENKLSIRVYIMIPVDFLDHLIDLGMCTGFGDNIVKIGGVKILADGSLGARTAALTEPYNDDPSTKGMSLYNQEQLNALVDKAHKAGLQLAIHAIGDQTVDMVLTALERALKKEPKKQHRHRIEHASVLNERLIQHMKKLGVMATVQPHFVISDFWVIDRVGPKRARWVYPFKTLIQKGVLTAGGSDCPVEPISPLLGIYAAVARKTFSNEGIAVDDALRLYTVNAAYASFEENIKGSIEVGKLADFVVLSHDPHEVLSDKIKDIQVEMTIVGGKVMHAKSPMEKA